jgi:hypothetical protein
MAGDITAGRELDQRPGSRFKDFESTSGAKSNDDGELAYGRAIVGRVALAFAMISTRDALARKAGSSCMRIAAP